MTSDFDILCHQVRWSGATGLDLFIETGDQMETAALLIAALPGSKIELVDGGLLVRAPRQTVRVSYR